ncbi:MAG: Ig-like domain-containing protein [Pirellulaceae bacterium]
MVGYTVDDPGPLGWEEDKLCSDRRTGSCLEWRLPEDLFHRPFGYQDNRHEGIYLDDFVIGFAERGEIVTNTPANDAIVGLPSGIFEGTYQLEVRRSSVYVAEGTSLLTRSFDTNERHATGYSITAPEGAEIYDGETFDLTDGIDYVRFEFDDTELNDGVQSGNFRIPFTTQDDDFEIAQSIRDAVNHSSVQATLNVAAASWDGKEGVRFPDAIDSDTFPDLRNGPLNTSNVVDLFGEVYVLTNSGVFGANNFDRPHTIAAEINDTTLTATATGITGFNSPRFISTGYIGDNADYPLQPGHDVDLFEFELDPGEQISISIEAQQLGTTLDAVATIFDSSGNFISQVNDTIGTDPSFAFTSPAAATDTFYLGISGHPVAGALSGTGSEYDPTVYESSVEGDTGSYRVELSFGVTVDTTFTIFDNPNDFDKLKMFGDQNHFRDQGQLILDSNRIAHSRGFGIEVDAGARDGGDGNQPHPGGVRHLDEINNERLVPGVVVSNNLITYSGGGGIHYSGDSNLPGQPLSAIPYGRIVNNTVYGSGAGDTGILIDQFASPTVLNNIVANTNTGISIDASSLSSGTVVGGSLYQGNSTNTNYTNEDFAISVSNNDPLFVDPSIGIENFYLAPSTNVFPNRAIDSSISSLEDRFDHELVKEPMGIPSSPILAPERDVTGQLRVDDPSVEPPNGLGANVYIDRGAMDRSDFSGPIASLIQPKDNDSENIDLNRGLTIVHVGPNDVVGSFQIRLFDGLEPTDPNEGVGISDGSVTTDAVIVRRNGELLVDGIDYSFSYNGTSDTIRLTPLAGIWTPDRLYTVELINKDHWRLEADNGFNIADGSMFSVTDSTGKTADFEFERGYTVVIPKTYEITVPPEGGGLGGITDGEFFTVRRGNEPPVTFEFDRDGDYVASRVPIVFEVNEEADSIAQKVRDALENIDLDFNPVFLGEGKIHVGSNATHNIDVSLTRLSIDGISGGVADGDYFSVDDGSKMLIFEFEDTDIADGIQQGDIQIDFSTGDTNENLADILVTAITDADLGLTPRNLGDGLVHIGGTVNHELITSNSNLSQFGTPSVRHEFGLRIPTRAGQIFNVQDAETFVLRKGAGVPVTFELNNLNEDSDYTLGNIKIDFTNTTSVEQLANSIVIAIQGAGLDLDPQIVPGTSIIDLGSDGTHTLNVANTNIEQVGLPGVDGANPVFVLPVEEFDAIQTAVAIRSAFELDELLAGVTVRQAGGASLIVNGASVVADQSGEFLVDEFGRLTPYQLFEIEDLATNPLKANQLSGETMFTIQLDRVDYDLGDAPDGVGVAPQNSYPTLTGHNAAIHMTIGTGPILGERRDRDIEGQSIALEMPAGADLTDGEQFSITAGTRTVVFEFDDDGSATAETVVIPFTAATTADALAQSVVDAVNTSGLGSNPRNLGSGVVLFETNQKFDLSAADSLTELLSVGDDLDGNNYVVDASGVTDVSTSVGATPLSIVVAANQAIAQGEIFTITSGSDVYTFEFDNDVLAVGVTDGNIRVPFTPGASEDVVAQNIADAIVAADLPLNLNPVVQSGGVVALNGDDEDGVTGVGGAAIMPLNAFTATEIEVSASGDGLLDAWVDFNRDGDWDDQGEQIFASEQVSAGVNSLSFSTPLEPDSKPGETYARFRISSEGGLAPTGLAKDGEVEDYVLTIVPGHPPEAKNDPDVGADGFDTDEDTPLPTGGNNPSLLTNDLDADGNDFRVNDFDAFSALGAEVTVNTGWKIADGATAGTFTYDPEFDDPNDGVDNLIQELAAGDIVTDTFSYSLIEAATDPPGDLGSAHSFESQTRAIVAITLTGVNDQPTSEDVALAVNEDGNTITASFVGDDVDRDDDIDTLTYTVINGLPANSGGLTNNNDGTFTFDPKAQIDFQWLGVDPITGPETTDVTFTYNATDRHSGVSVDSTVTITVSGENDLPVAADDSYSVDQDSTLIETAANGVILHDDGDSVVDTDPDVNDVLLVTQVDGTDLVAGEVTVQTAKGAQLIMFSDGSFEYDPRGSATLLALNDGESDSDSFEYKIEDPHGEGSLATVTIAVQGVNDPPVAADDSYTVDQDQTLVAPLIDPALAGILDNDTDADAGDSFEVATVQGVALTGGTITIGTAQNATVTITSDGNMTYDPTTAVDSNVAFTLPDIARGDSDNDTFTYTIEDLEGDTAQATVTISVIGVNKDPIAEPDLYDDVTNTEDSAIIIDAANGVINHDDGDGIVDMDPETDSIEVSGINGTTSRIGVSDMGATINVTISGVVIYDPTQRDAQTGEFLSPLVQALDPGEIATDEFTYTIVDYIDDGNGGKIYQGGSSTATVQIEVQGVNDDPVTVDDVVRMERNTVANPNMISIDVTANDTDADNYVDENSGSPISGTSTVTIVGVLANGTAVVNGLNIEYTPDLDYSGGEVISYTVTDEHGAVSDVAVVTIEVNDHPVAVDDAETVYQDIQNTPKEIQVLGNDSDTDGVVDATTVVIVDSPTNGVIVSVESDGRVVYRPNDDYIGPDLFTYQFQDDDGDWSNVATVSIDVIDDPYPWQNKANPLDVNWDGEVSPIDALLIITYMNDHPGNPTLPTPTPGNSPPPFLDPNGDNSVDPIDALMIINYLNANANGEGEDGPEGEYFAPVIAQATAPAVIYTDAILDGQQLAERNVEVATESVLESATADVLDTVDNRYQSQSVTDLRSQRAVGLSTVRGDLLEDLLDDIAGDISDNHDDGLGLDDWM